MISPSILFYWGKGAATRRSILRIVSDCGRASRPCFLCSVAEKLKVTHAAAKKHIDLLIEEGYLSQLNPSGKPVYLVLPAKGKAALTGFWE